MLTEASQLERNVAIGELRIWLLVRVHALRIDGTKSPPSSYNGETCRRPDTNNRRLVQPAEVSVDN